MAYEKQLDGLSLLNIEKVYASILDIDEKLQLKPSDCVNISVRSVSAPKFWVLKNYILGSISERQKEFREDALGYLKTIGIIKKYNLNNAWGTIDIEGIDINKFTALKKEIAVYYDKKFKEKNDSKNKIIPKSNNNDPLKDIRARLEALATRAETEGQKEPLAGLRKLSGLIGEVELLKKQMQEQIDKKPTNASQIIYEIKYTPAREILLNNFLLSKVNFNSENDNVFSYIYQHPNKKINISELEKPAGGKLTKPLHKIVENLGFKGEIKKAFFNISKNDIFFRNPIKQKELDDLGVSRLKLPE